MSWSLNVTGKPEDLQKQVADLLTQQHCAEPEESIKAAVADVIDQSLKAMSTTKTVTISAIGSQSQDPNNSKRFNNSVQLSINYA